MILVIDNYDSFTYNLVQYLGELGAELSVRRNDKTDVAEVKRLQPDGVVISPGPGRPEDAGISVALIRELSHQVPMLGVCLGHQAIAAAFGGEIVPAPVLMHGKTSEIFHDNTGLFQELPQPFTATRYHSLVVEEASLTEDLTVTARTSDDVIMGLRHTSRPLLGVQFHPESILTGEGKQLLRNFINMCKREQQGKERS